MAHRDPRVLGFVVPEENVTVALPDVSDTAEPSERNPVSAEKIHGAT